MFTRIAPYYYTSHSAAFYTITYSALSHSLWLYLLLFSFHHSAPGNPACLSRVLTSLLDADTTVDQCSNEKLAFRLYLAGRVHINF